METSTPCNPHPDVGPGDVERVGEEQVHLLLREQALQDPVLLRQRLIDVLHERRNLKNGQASFLAVIVKFSLGTFKLDRRRRLESAPWVS